MEWLEAESIAIQGSGFHAGESGTCVPACVNSAGNTCWCMHALTTVHSQPHPRWAARPTNKELRVAASTYYGALFLYNWDVPKVGSQLALLHKGLFCVEGWLRTVTASQLCDKFRDGP